MLELFPLLEDMAMLCRMFAILMVSVAASSAPAVERTMNEEMERLAQDV